MTTCTITVVQADNEADLRDVALVKNLLTPSEPVTVEELQHHMGSHPDGLMLVARLDGVLAGSVICNKSGAPSCAFAMLRVLPAFRGQGLGTAFYEAVSRHARLLGREHLQGRVVETDGDALDFFTKRGFVEVGRECKVVLDVNEAPEVKVEAPAGMEIRSLVGLPEDLVQGAHRVACESYPDIPLPERLPEPSFDKWYADELGLPNARLDGSFVAVLDGQVIGYAGMADAEEGTGEHLLTGVLRAWRGCGVANALKQAQIEWAKTAGLSQLYTYMMEGNAPIRNLNSKLGYHPEPASLLLRGPLLGER